MTDGQVEAEHAPTNQPLNLNFLPVNFSADRVTGFVSDYRDEAYLTKLQQEHQDTFVLLRSSSAIFGHCWDEADLLSHPQASPTIRSEEECERNRHCATLLLT